MNQMDFIDALEQQLQIAGGPFDRADVLAFARDCWPWIEENPDVTYWAKAFITEQIARTLESVRFAACQEQARREALRHGRKHGARAAADHPVGRQGILDPGITKDVYRFIEDETGHSVRRIRPDTTLLGDIKIDGDDADEFFEHFASRFQVDMAGFTIDRHFHSERELLSSSPLGCLLLPLILAKSWAWPDAQDLHEVCGKVPIRVRDLLEAAESKKWPSRPEPSPPPDRGDVA
jgi:hypothetical protein